MIIPKAAKSNQIRKKWGIESHISLNMDFILDKLHKNWIFLEYLTVGYNLTEAAVSTRFGHIAGSIALIGFGLDCVVE